METITLKNPKKHRLISLFQYAIREKIRENSKKRGLILWFSFCLSIPQIALCQDIDTGLQHYYKFDGNLVDSAVGSFNGSITAGTLDLVDGFDALPNSAYYFDGTDKVSFGNISLASGSFTLAFWMKVPALTSNWSHSLLSKRAICGEGQFFDLRVTNSSTTGYSVGVEMRDDGQSGHVSTPFGSFNEWVHVAFVKNNTTQTSSLFINGDSVISTIWTSALLDMTNVGNFAIGSTPCLNINTSTYPFKGTLDEVRFYDRACSEADIFAMTTTGAPVFSLASSIIYLERNFGTTTLTPLNQNQAGVVYSYSSDPSNPEFIIESFDTVTGELTLTSVPDSSGSIKYTISAEANGKIYNLDVEVTVRRNYEDGIIAFFPFNGNANEAYGQSTLDGTVTNAVTAKDRQNKLTSAYYFDGNGDYITLADNDLMDFDDYLDFSVSLWFRTPQSATNQMLFDKGANPRYYANITTTGNLRLILAYGGSNFEELITLQDFDDDLWHHAAFTVDRDGMAKIYVDGIEEASLILTKVGTLSTNYGLRFGSTSDQGSWFYKGYLDDIRIYNRAISSAETTILANEKKPSFLSVETISPQNNGVVGLNDTIRIGFQKNFDLATASNISVYGSLSGKLSGSFTGTSELVFISDNAFQVGEKIVMLVPSTFLAADGDTLIKPLVLTYYVKPDYAFENPIIFGNELTIDAAISGNTAAVSGDMDNDGDIDIVALSAGEGKITLYSNNGSAVFTQSNLSTSMSGANDVKVADIDNDGDLDILIVLDQSVVWFQNLENNNFDAVATLLNVTYAKSSLVLADINTDGHIDILTIGTVWNNPVLYFKNNGNASSFANAVAAIVQPNYNETVKMLVAANVDEDPELELIVATQATGGSIRIYDPNQTFSSFTNTSKYNYPYDYGNYSQGIGEALTVADFNHDGFIDIAMASRGANNSSFSKLHYMTGLGEGNFSPATEVLTFASGWKNYQGLNLTAADVDGDMDLDLIYYAYDNKLGWIENMNGTFSNALHTINTNAFPPHDNFVRRIMPAEAVDLDGDGRLEIMVATNAKIIYHTQNDILSLVSHFPSKGAFMVNPDTLIRLTFDYDIEATSIDSSSFRVYSHFRSYIKGTRIVTGNQVTFTPDEPFWAGENIKVELTPGITDLSASTLNYEYFEFFAANDTISQGMPAFSLKSAGLTTTEIARIALPGDIDNDGDLDLVYNNENSGAWYKIENINGSFSQGQASLMATRSNSLIFNGVMTDFDKNGTLDLLTIGRYEYMGLVKNNLSNGTFTYQDNFSSGQANAEGRSIDISDTDKDGKPDILTTFYGKTNVLTYEMQVGIAAPQSSYTVASGITQPCGGKFFDINADGYDDILLADYGSDGKLRLYINNKSGGYTMQELASINNATYIEVYDLDLDGDADIICGNANTTGNLNIIENNGNGTFTNHEVAATTQPIFIAAGDINADGLPDVVFHSWDNKLLGYLRNIGDLSFAIDTILPTVDSYFLNLSDLDKDGDLDISTTYPGTSNNWRVYIIENRTIDNNVAPVATGTIADLTILEDQYFEYNIDVSSYFEDADGDDLIFSALSDVADVSASINNNLAVILSGTNNFNGTATILITANDGVASTNLSFTLTITPVNDPPTGSAGTISGNEDEPLVFKPSDFAYSDIENDTLAIIQFSTIASGTKLFKDDNQNDLLDDGELIISGTEFSVNEFYKGLVKYRPDVNAFGSNLGLFRVKVGDGTSLSLSDYLYYISINPVNDEPYFSFQTNDVYIGKNFEGSLKVPLFPGSPSNETDEIITYSINPTNTSFVTMSFNTQTGQTDFTAITDASGEQEFTITANDGQSENNTYSASFTLHVLSNQPPVVINSIGNLTTTEDAISVVLSANLSQVFSDPEGDALTFEASSDDTDNVHLSVSANQLIVNFEPNYFGEAQISVAASDGNGMTVDQFVLTVTPVNDVPSFTLDKYELTLEQNFSAEEVYLTSTQPANENDQTITYSLGSTSPSLVNMDIDSNTGTIYFAPVNNAYGNFTFQVIANDGQASDNIFSTNFTITINRINEGPTDISLSGQTVYENNESVPVWIGSISTTDADDSNGFTYNLIAGDGDADNNQFYIENGNLYAYIYFDFEEKLQYQVRLKTTDPWGASFEKAFTIYVEDGNDLPTFISLLNVSLIENSPIGTLVGTFAVTDQDANDTHNIIFTNGEFITDNENFVIEGMNLLLNASVDYESKTTYSIYLRAEDSHGGIVFGLFDIEVTDLVETGIKINPNMLFKIYPNPTNGFIYLENISKLNETLYIKVFNLSGQAIYESKMSNLELTNRIDLRQQPAGTYLLQIILNHATVQHILIIE